MITPVSASLADETSSSSPELAALTILTALCTNLDLRTMFSCHVKHCMLCTPWNEVGMSPLSLCQGTGLRMCVCASRVLEGLRHTQILRWHTPCRHLDMIRGRWQVCSLDSQQRTRHWGKATLGTCQQSTLCGS